MLESIAIEDVDIMYPSKNRCFMVVKLKFGDFYKTYEMISFGKTHIYAKFKPL
jgi:hypothetical protein